MKLKYIPLALMIIFSASCAQKSVSNQSTSTPPRVPASTEVTRHYKVYPSYNQMKVAKEIIQEAMVFKRKSAEAKRASTKKKYWEKFVKKFNKIDTFISGRTISYSVELNAGIFCDGHQDDCSTYHFYDGSVCYKGDIKQALELLEEEFAGMGDEETVEQFAISGKKITYMFIDQKNEWSEEGSMSKCD